MAPIKDNKWIRRFIIPETTRHKKGFTIYKVTSMIFFNSSHEEVSKVSVWKRYNDFKKLHSELSNLHKQLGIKESFPTFPKSKYFRRFETEVVEERRKYALKFLEFIGRHSYLYSSGIFITFFETSHVNNFTSDCAHSLSSDTSEDDRTVASSNSVLTNDAVTQKTFQVLQPSKTIHNKLTNSRCTSSNIISKNIDEFGVSQAKNESQNNTDLQNISFKKDEQSHKMTKQHIQNTDHDKVRNNLEIKNVTNNVNDKSEFDNLNNNTNKNCDTTSSKYVVTLHRTENLSQKESDLTQYILIAAGHISAAFTHESIAEYKEAFTQYKLGISCLISGVQLDPDSTRVTCIKNKISKYLTQAEHLYNKHLNCNMSIINKSESELQYYKILKIIKSVMLATDIRVNCNRIIKTVERSSLHEDNINNYVLRRPIPYMVNLYACVKTETTIFLILQYASCGKLWDFIRLHYKISDCLNTVAISNHISTNNQINEEFNNNENISELNKVDEIIEKQDHPCSIDGQSKIYNMKIPTTTTQLLENSQKLLQSVDATLKRSDSIASRLNKAKEIKHSENTSSPNVKSITQLSQNSDLIISSIYHNKSLYSNSVNANDATINKSLSTQNFIEDKNSKSHYFSTLSENSSKNSRIRENVYVLNGNCATSDVFEHKTSNLLYNTQTTIQTSTQTTIQTSMQNISINDTIQISKNNDVENIFDGMNYSNINHNISGNDNLVSGKNCNEKQHADLCKENNVDIDEERKLWKIPDTIIRTWAAEIILAIEALHQQNILILDFKPDNILLDDTGHICLTYIVPQRNIELLKLTYPYSSPESTTFSPTILVTSATDIWSFGVILYELLTGIAFSVKHPGLFHSHSTINIPDELSKNAKSLLYGMLRYYPEERLTIDKIKNHPFFTGINWSNIIDSRT